MHWVQNINLENFNVYTRITESYNNLQYTSFMERGRKFEQRIKSLAGGSAKL